MHGRYPDKDLVPALKKAAGLYGPGLEPGVEPGFQRSFIILTMANDLGMQRFVKKLLASLSRFKHGSSAGEEPRPLTQYTAVMGVTHEAFAFCSKLEVKYHQLCLADPISGLHDGDISHPSALSLSFGFMKVRCARRRARRQAEAGATASVLVVS